MQQTTYGALARIGIATPQANPTVEPELAQLWPAGVSMLVARLVSRGEPRQRLLDYFTRLDTTMQQFGGLQLDAFGFACTASSYLLEDGIEAAACQGLAETFGYPVITAAAALEQSLHAIGASRLAIASPYPEWIHELCMRHWQRRGFEVVAGTSASAQTRDTVNIYSLDPHQAAAHFVSQLQGVQADALLITGTGMPTLPLIPTLEAQLGLPVLSSNLCLARACLKAAGVNSPEPIV